MRGTRWLFLAAIVAILGGIGIKYRDRLKALQVQDEALAKPAPLPSETDASSEKWRLVITDTKDGTARTAAIIQAAQFQQPKGSDRVELKQVELRISGKKGDSYDLVKSDAATFFKSDSRLHSDGNVEITLNLPNEGTPRHAPVTIWSSGVNYDTTGRAETDQPSKFRFERGEGAAIGASYDPTAHVMLMKSNVVLNWTPAGAHAKPMKIEAGSLEYGEGKSLIELRPWGRLTRENMVVEGENVFIHLEDDGEGHKSISRVEAVRAHGTEDNPNRKVQYSADELWVVCNDEGVIEKITARTNARLVSTSDTTETTITANMVDMSFEPDGHDSILTAVDASGNAVVNSRPLPAPGRQPGETHVLRSDQIALKMKPGGHEIASVVTRTPGTLEFIPNVPTERHRVLEGSDLAITYGPQNRIESLHATGVKTHTDPTADEKKHNRGVAVTASHEILAHFDPKTSKMSSIDQSGEFTYDEDDRHARAAKATLDGDQNVIVLENSARMWDSTASTSADRIRLDQRTGDFTADGNVNSSQVPDKDQKRNSEMLSGDQPIQAQARKMVSTNRNRTQNQNGTVHYEGGVLLWQGANRIQAQTVDLDRDKHFLIADGNVVTNLWEEPKDDAKNPAPKKKSTDPVLTVVHAQHLVYTETNRLAVYTGGVLLTRPGLQVKSREMHAYMAESKPDSNDSRLEKAIADGAVVINQTSKAGKRTGTAEHAEYYTQDQRVFLRDGQPKLVEQPPNGKDKTTEGENLTYFANDDRLLVNGSPARPGQSQIKRK